LILCRQRATIRIIHGRTAFRDTWHVVLGRLLVAHTYSTATQFESSPLAMQVRAERKLYEKS
jgi:hypothetical protein